MNTNHLLAVVYRSNQLKSQSQTSRSFTEAAKFIWITDIMVDPVDDL